MERKDYPKAPVAKATDSGRSVPRLLFVSHSCHAGGAQRCLELLLDALGPYPCERLVVAPPRRPICRPGLGDGIAPIERLGVPVIRSPLEWWLGSWPRYTGFVRGLARRVQALAQVIRQRQIDLVVTNTATVVEGALAARACGVRHVWHVLEMPARDPVLKPFLSPEELYRTVTGLSHRVVFVSKAVLGEMRAYGGGQNAVVVHTGLPPSPIIATPSRARLLGLPDDVPLAVCVGVLSLRKGVLDLVDAMPAVLRRVPRARLLFIGPDGGQQAALRRRIDARHLHDAVRLLGPRNDVTAILKVADILALPSHSDPLPVVVLEAMRAGLPVVATRSGGSEEMVVDGQTGRLVPAANPAAMAEAIAGLLADAPLRATMACAAQERFARCFALQGHGEAFWNVLKEVLDEPPSPAGQTEVQAIIAGLVAAAQSAVHAQRHLSRGGRRLREELMVLLARWSLLG